MTEVLTIGPQCRYSEAEKDARKVSRLKIFIFITYANNQVFLVEL
jgi:hypothetical protein